MPVPGGAYQQDAFGQFGPQPRKAGRFLQEGDHFLDFFHGFFHTGHVFEGDFLGGIHGVDAGLVFSHIQKTGALAHATKKKAPQENKKHQRQYPIGQEVRKPVGFDFPAVVHPMGLQVGNETGITQADNNKLLLGRLFLFAGEQVEVQMPGGLFARRLEFRG